MLKFLLHDKEQKNKHHKAMLCSPRQNLELKYELPVFMFTNVTVHDHLRIRKVYHECERRRV